MRYGHHRKLTAVLRTSADGRRLTARRGGSKVRYSFRCASDRAGRVAGWLRLVRRGPRGPAIRGDGSFRAVKSRGRLRYAVRGRFVSPDAVRVSYRISLPPGRAKNRRHPGRCRSPHTRVALRTNGEPEFTSCRSQQATNVLSSEGRIFRQRTLDTVSGAWGPYFLRNAYGCLYSVGRRIELGLDDDADSGDGGYKELFRLSGPYTAYQHGCTSEGCYPALSVVDLRDGREVRTSKPVMSPTGDWIYWAASATDLVLKPNASVAWISDAEGRGPEVWAFDGVSHRRLDAGMLIQKKSLELNGSSVQWKNGDQWRSAPLR